MLNFPAIAADYWSLIVATVGIARFWYAVPLITSVSLVCAATRHEDMRAILVHALRFALWVLVFMGIVLGGIQLLSWWQ
jgi:hypothetical protein